MPRKRRGDELGPLDRLPTWQALGVVYAFLAIFGQFAAWQAEGLS